MKKLSIVIITWNQSNKLKRCLDSIFDNDNCKEDIEIIVIDNYSTDNTLLMLKDYTSRIRLIVNKKNRGVAPARNQGIKIAKGDYVMMLDDDTQVKPGCFSKIISFMDSHEDCWCLGTKQIRPNGNTGHNVRTFYDLPTIIARRTLLGRFMKDKIRHHLMLDWDHNSTKEVDWVAGANFVMRGKAIKSIGAFDEKYFFGFEDVDWCYRIKLAGKQVYYLHDAVIVHDFQRTSRKFFSKKALDHLLSSIRFYTKFRNNYLKKTQGIS